MASARMTHQDGTFFPFLRLPTELRHCIYRFAMPSTIRPCESSSETCSKDQNQQKPSIALFLISKQIHEEISYSLYQYSRFLISINSARAACVALESPILWKLDQTEAMSVKMASSIRHIAVDLEWTERRSSMNLRMVTLLGYVCEHLRAFRSLQTLTVGWKRNGDSNSGPRVEYANYILEPLEELRAELPHVQITVQVTQQQRKTATGEQCETATGDTSNNNLPAYVKLQEYFSELRRDGEYPNVVRDCESQGEGFETE